MKKALSLRLPATVDVDGLEAARLMDGVDSVRFSASRLGAVSGLQFVDDPALLATTDDAGALVLYKLHKLSLVCQTIAHKGGVNGIAGTGAMLYTVGEDGNLRFFAVAPDRLVGMHTFPLSSSFVVAVAALSCGDGAPPLVATASLDHAVHVVDGRSKSVVMSLRTGGVRSLCGTPAAPSVVFTAGDSGAAVYDLRYGGKASDSPRSPLRPLPPVGRGPSPAVPLARYGESDPLSAVFDPFTRRFSPPFVGHGTGASLVGIACGPWGREVATSADDGTVEGRNTATGAGERSCHAEPGVGGGGSFGLTTAPAYLAGHVWAGASDGRLRAWRTDRRGQSSGYHQAPVHVVTDHHGPVTALAAASGMVATGGADGSVVVRSC